MSYLRIFFYFILTNIFFISCYTVVAYETYYVFAQIIDRNPWFPLLLTFQDALDWHIALTFDISWHFALMYFGVCYGYILNLILFLVMAVAFFSLTKRDLAVYTKDLFAVFFGIAFTVILISLSVVALKFLNLNFFISINSDSLFFFCLFYLPVVTLLGWSRGFLLNLVFKLV